MNANIALFIDAENVSYKHIAPLIEELKRKGKLGSRIAFGEPEYFCAECWRSTAVSNCLDCRFVPKLVKGKSASDHALNVSVMDFVTDQLHEDVDTICIMSSDSDFASLRSQLVQRGKSVIIAGNYNQMASDYRDNVVNFIDLKSLSGVEKPTAHLTKDVNQTKPIKPQEIRCSPCLVQITIGYLNGWLKQNGFNGCLPKLLSTGIHSQMELKAFLTKQLSPRLTKKQLARLKLMPDYHVAIALYISQTVKNVIVTSSNNMSKFYVTKIN